jgi:hypothetical protein
MDPLSGMKLQEGDINLEEHDVYFRVKIGPKLMDPLLLIPNSNFP